MMPGTHFLFCFLGSCWCCLMLYNLVTDVVLLLLASAALAMRSSDGTTLVILRSHASLDTGLLLSRLPVWSGGPLACAATPRVKPRRASSDGQQQQRFSLYVCPRQKASCRQVVSLKRYILLCIITKVFKTQNTYYFLTRKCIKIKWRIAEGGKKCGCFHEVFIAFF